MLDKKLFRFAADKCPLYLILKCNMAICTSHTQTKDPFMSQKETSTLQGDNYYDRMFCKKN